MIVALDVDTIREEEELLERLKGTITFYKIGLQLFTAHGKRAVDLVHRAGNRVFLDLKFCDIPQTVANAVRETQKLGVEAVSLHLSGGADMLRAAAELRPRPKLWGVTVLTSMTAADLHALHPRAGVRSAVRNLARLGLSRGIDGIICSGNEVEPLRKALNLEKSSKQGIASLSHGPRFITPGIRPADNAVHDQKRVITPEKAAELGIDYIVIGRPITAAPDPLKAAQKILGDMKAAAPRAIEKSC
ncbi:MAG: orotidine 5'-phosphate decarboxylase [Elusimicrobia bacterium RIFCSPHIGHO2_02_FULL_57_9]|nr:MAG: orotidine 5'-phosphate decarboxylase [Elusimicrobia bacterium RIFCSPHIGHO2_02_FULL_57_9]